MQTVLEILNKTTEYFKKCGVPDSRLDAQYIISKGLGLSRMELYLKFDRPLTEQELVALRAMVARRGKREPLQHVLGSTSFCGHEIKCDRRALIPRPETEILVELVLKYIKDIKNPYIADVGTGTGAIAIAIALARPDATLLALDDSPDALALAQENIELHALAERVHVLRSNLLEKDTGGKPFDLIASNLPYIPTATMANLQQEVKEFDPPMALDGGDDGLVLVRKLLLQCASRLNPAGIVLLEVGEGQSGQLGNEKGAFPGLVFTKSHADLEKVDRFPEFRKDSAEIVGDML
jgi:release factor glutamine methyltransferase